MISRYSLPEMQKIWSDENKYNTWLEVEKSYIRALKNHGKIPQEDFDILIENMKYDLKEVQDFETQYKHDVIAFLQSVNNSVENKSLAKWIHYGLTSSDLLDTSFSCILYSANDQIICKLLQLKSLLEDLAVRYQYSLMIGRTHGVHAEPTTFGFKMLSWHQELVRIINSIRRLKYVGKMSGAVGNFAHIDMELQDFVCFDLLIEPDTVSTQIVSRDIYAQHLTSLSYLATFVEKCCVTLRTLQRTEISEVKEPFSESQKGSSAMPHKVNPIVSEQLCGLARLVRHNACVALENNVLWDERDISHSSSERVIFPDSYLMIDYMLSKFICILNGLEVNTEKMLDNLYSSGRVFLSQKLLLLLLDKNLDRDFAYRIVQQLSFESMKSKLDFVDVCCNNKEILNHFTAKKLQEELNVDIYLSKMTAIFKKILNK